MEKSACALYMEVAASGLGAAVHVVCSCEMLVPGLVNVFEGNHQGMVW